VTQWQAQHYPIVGEIPLPFFQDLYLNVIAWRYNSGITNSSSAQIMNAVTAYVDSFVITAKKFFPSNGSIGGQVH
jgi:hypothetical protein